MTLSEVKDVLANAHIEHSKLEGENDAILFIHANKKHQLFSSSVGGDPEVMVSAIRQMINSNEYSKATLFLAVATQIAENIDDNKIFSGTLEMLIKAIESKNG